MEFIMNTYFAISSIFWLFVALINFPLNTGPDKIISDKNFERIGATTFVVSVFNIILLISTWNG
jgi:hypothetical protein